jgi:hypothetical protein
VIGKAPVLWEMEAVRVLQNIDNHLPDYGASRLKKRNHNYGSFVLTSLVRWFEYRLLHETVFIFSKPPLAPTLRVACTCFQHKLK